MVMIVCTISRAVSVAEQNSGGLSVQPICNAVGTTISMSSIGVFLACVGSTYAKFHASSLLTLMRQNPSFMSIFEKIKGWLGLWWVAMRWMSRLSACPNCTIDCGGDRVLVASLTDGIGFPLMRRLKLRSRMALNALLLWGIMAIGEILSCGGTLCLMSPHLTTVAKPWLTLSFVSSRRAA